MAQSTNTTFNLQFEADLQLAFERMVRKAATKKGHSAAATDTLLAYADGLIKAALGRLRTQPTIPLASRAAVNIFRHVAVDYAPNADGVAHLASLVMAIVVAYRGFEPTADNKVEAQEYKAVEEALQWREKSDMVCITLTTAEMDMLRSDRRKRVAF